VRALIVSRYLPCSEKLDYGPNGPGERVWYEVAFQQIEYTVEPSGIMQTTNSFPCLPVHCERELHLVAIFEGMGCGDGFGNRRLRDSTQAPEGFNHLTGLGFELAIIGVSLKLAAAAAAHMRTASRLPVRRRRQDFDYVGFPQAPPPFIHPGLDAIARESTLQQHHSTVEPGYAPATEGQVLHVHFDELWLGRSRFHHRGKVQPQRVHAIPVVASSLR
jgi:hypothetical protein